MQHTSRNSLQTPPYAEELEKAVIGAILVDKNAIGSVSEQLRPDVFYNNKHRLIYEAIQTLVAQGHPIDSLSVTDMLKNTGTLEDAGGVTYIAELTRSVATSAHLYYHAQLLIKKAVARELITLASDIAAQSYDETHDIKDIMKIAEDRIFEVSQRSQKRPFVQIDSVIPEAFERLKKAGSRDGNLSGIPSGFTELDEITSGWQKSDLIIIAARPAMGKTAFVLSMIKNMTVDHHIPVAMFSLEMPNVQLVNRLFMNVCTINGEKIKNGKLSSQEWDRLKEGINILKDAPLFVDDTPGLTIQEFKSKAKKLVQNNHVQLIIIDYLQLLTVQGMKYGSTREQEVSIISRSLKALAKDLDIPIIALSQLNRGVESRTSIEGRIPKLSDLRESGAIEQDADMVCFLHRPEYYGILTDKKEGFDLKGLCMFIIAKHRNGAVKDIWLRFVKQYAKFFNMDEYFEDPDFTAYSDEISIQSLS